MTTPLTGKAATFLALHVPGEPLLQPNAWDTGSAKVLASVGFSAVATTSSGFAGTAGRLDGQMSRDQVLAHCEALAAAVDIPVAADFENGFADAPDEVAGNVVRAAATGLAGVSIEDWSGDGIYHRALAVERVSAAVAAAGPSLVVTARCENLIKGVDDFDDTIARLNAYKQAGAHVLFAPGLRTVEAIRTITSNVDGPVNVLLSAGAPTVAEAADAGVARISVGGSLAVVAYAALVDAAEELRDHGTHARIDAAMARSAEIRNAFGR